MLAHTTTTMATSGSVTLAIQEYLNEGKVESRAPHYSRCTTAVVTMIKVL